MVGIDTDQGQRLRPVFPPQEYADRLGRGELFERGGYLVQPDRRLSQLTPARPPGVTSHQWNSAIRTQLHFVVGDRRDCRPVLGVCFDDPAQHTGDAERVIRMTDTVCEAVGLPLLRVESPTLRPERHGRRIVEYVLDARAFSDAAPVGEPAGEPVGDEPPPERLGYRDIVGRLPDGRSGYVNDLGAVARGAAVEAYIARQVADPIIRGLHVEWSGGVAEGWAWLDVRDGRCLFERVRLWLRHFPCGVEPGRLAEDLAVTAIGERLRTLELTEPVLCEKGLLAGELARLRARRDEMRTPFAFAHVSF